MNLLSSDLNEFLAVLLASVSPAGHDAHGLLKTLGLHMAGSSGFSRRSTSVHCRTKEADKHHVRGSALFDLHVWHVRPRYLIGRLASEEEVRASEDRQVRHLLEAAALKAKARTAGTS